MKVKIIFICLLIGCLAFNCQSTSETTMVPGVSLELAKDRKQHLDNIKYDIDFSIPKDSATAVTGTVTIHFSLKDSTGPVYLDFKASPTGVSKLEVNGKVQEAEVENEHIFIPAEALVKGYNKVTVSFTSGTEGLTRQKEFLFSLLVPGKARTLFPCFDQPDLKAEFTVAATIPDDWEMITNGPFISNTVKGGSKQIRFGASDKISTYLFSIVAGKFSRETRKVGNREMNFYYRETNAKKIAQSMDAIFDLHRLSLEFMEKYTGIAYPFKKFDAIAIPDFPYGGMEHVGAIDYRESTLFLDETAKPDDKLDRAHLIAHETSHMWFGNLVTMEWFNDVWMKEVFANFMADKIINEVMPGNDSRFSFMMEHHPMAYYIDRTEGANPIRQELDNLNNAGSLYGNIIYDKAPIAMNQLEMVVGKPMFQKGLQEYLKKYAGSNADWPDLINILESLGAKDIKQWNTSWIDKTGRPDITYNLSVQDGKVKSFAISQKDRNNEGKLWNQFFTVAFVYDDDVKLIPVNLKGTAMTVNGVRDLPKPKFIVFNATGEGYGLFPVDKGAVNAIAGLKEPVTRASAYLNLYENMLEGKCLAPIEFLDLYAVNMETEDNEIILNRMGRQFRNIYWQFLTPEQRKQNCVKFEKATWDIAASASSETKKRAMFDLYSSVALSDTAVARLYECWKSEKGPAGITLTDDELTSYVAELAIRNYPETETLLKTQLGRIKNADSKARFRYLLPSLSNDIKVRDAYFASLGNDRENESYILTALAYLHHPLRMAESEKYLSKTLDLLAEVKAKGDIFFPSGWLSSTFGYYQSESAASVVTNFLKSHQDYDKNLRLKILQETDDLFRARKILAKQKPE